MDIHIDIETVPAQDPAIIAEMEEEAREQREALESSYREKLDAVVAPKNYKDPEKIADYMESKKEELLAWLERQKAQLEEDADEKYRKTALDGARGEICVISWAVNDGPIRHVCQDPTGQAADADEAGMLREFFKDLQADAEELPPESRNRRLRWIGHNILGFDLRFIFQRCVIHQIPPAVSLHQAAPPHSDFIFDTMLEWAGFRGRVSESNLCKALGIADKGSELEGTDAEGIDGSQVWDYVKAGRLDDVVTYCDGDVDRSRRIFNALTFRGAA